MSRQGFQKFIQQKENGAKKKERIRQEKKKARQETKEYFEQKKKEARAGRQPSGDSDQVAGSSRQPSGKPSSGKRKTTRGGKQATGNRYQRSGIGDQASGIGPQPSGKQPAERKKTTHGSRPATDSRYKRSGAGDQVSRKPPVGKKKAAPANKPVPESKQPAALMPLNKFIAHAGVCSRRDAAEWVKTGKVTVNGEKITEPGHKVTEKDEIKVQGKKVTIRKNFVYILLNKPKDYITTTDDPQGRKTVLDIVKKATTERVYPVGRLDRNTTGVLLLTNDGELAQKLAHPSYQVKKIYEVKLDKPLLKKDFDSIVKGIQLEDGFIAPDTMAYADSRDKSVIGIEIHSGRNRIVRRIFEHLGYDVRNLDRVMYANLTKKNVERGRWRLLTEKEVRLLKFLNASYTRK